ncbi:TPA: KilA-N domain-containing protein [Haemophilus influenzae]|uniref:KilA-N domain-containing protein n=1 Tax=Haemophilus influenzae TaxID=727 RepID=UPI000CFEA210|nr:KilA-N domain-containing protein [Haemophilus influenzae]PRI37703.1 KilA-N domain protein [Haemophilus influenzae]PRI98629.1 KilA-N domain protein [Haemophilus influenzae]PRJ55715.1 KilA-N domain protein [Haemophilus influenzae]PRJ58073.1 KilA-N domain protein [Haemophilus influenzae]PRM49539.1 KilA-N domain protein [Haemophilus influenzae]
MKNQIILANEVIALDEHGRISLNTLHKLSGEGSAKKPDNWLRLQSTQELLAEIRQFSDLRTDPLIVINGGNERGTYAHELLAVSYAGWISPRFQLQVNQAFLDSYRQPTVSENINISKDEYIDLLKSKIHLLERKKKHHRRANKPLSTQEKSQIVLLHRQGLSNRQIAEKLNRSIATVWALVR